jgi:DNA modification methylase
MLLLADGVAERAEKVGFVLKDIIIWHKPVSVPTSGKANFTDRYEHVLFFTKDKRNYYLNREIKDQINDYLDGPLPNLLNVWRIHRRIGNIGKKIMVSKAGKKIEHTAIYPDELVRRIIELCSQKNDLVIDPFTGSGTTVSTANKLGRKWIGYELNTSYNELISWRLKSDVIV